MSRSTRLGEQSSSRSDPVTDYLNLFKESDLQSSRLCVFSLTLVLTSLVTFCSSGSLLIKPLRLLDCYQVVVFVFGFGTPHIRGFKYLDFKASSGVTSSDIRQQQSNGLSVVQLYYSKSFPVNFSEFCDLIANRLEGISS
jgi:hypothetical protein